MQGVRAAFTQFISSHTKSELLLWGNYIEWPGERSTIASWQNFWAWDTRFITPHQPQHLKTLRRPIQNQHPKTVEIIYFVLFFFWTAAQCSCYFQLVLLYHFHSRDCYALQMVGMVVMFVVVQVFNSCEDPHMVPVVLAPSPPPLNTSIFPGRWFHHPAIPLLF